jgi:multiple sugar transport system substrate-binding protein
MSSAQRHEDVNRLQPPTQLSRRALLRGAGGIGLASVVPALAAVARPSNASAAPGSVAAPVRAPHADTVELKLNARTGSEQQIFEGFISQFTEQNPNIKITGQYFTPTNQEYFQKVAVLIAGGTQGDLVWMSSIEGYYDYASRGTWLAVDDYAAKDAIDNSAWYPAAVSMLKIGDASYALPLWSHPSIVGLYYNKDLLDQNGIEVPDGTWTTDTLAATAAQLTKRTGDTADVLGYAPAVEYFNGLCQVIPSFGGEPISADGKTMTLTEDKAKAAIQWLADLFVTSKVAPTQSSNYYTDTQNLMLSQKLAMKANGYWGRWDAKANWKFNWSVAPIANGPAGNTGAMLQTDSVPISKSSKHPDEAWLFHKFTSTKDAGMFLWQQNYLPGSRADVWEDPTLMADPTHAVYANLMKTASPLYRPANFRFREFEIAINQALTNAWLGQKSVDDAIADATKAGQAILDKGPA